MIFFHSGGVGSDCSAFYADTKPFDCICRIVSYFVVCFVAVFKTQIVIFGLEINKRFQKFFFDYSPKHASHFVAVEFCNCVFHLYFRHNTPQILLN